MTEDKEEKTLKDYLVEIDVSKRTKRCSKCKKTFPATSEYFYRRRALKNGLDSWCKTCSKLRDKKTHIRKKYGLSFSELQEIIRKQDNRCVICNKVFIDLVNGRGVKDDDYPIIDHDHKTGAIRDILCNSCNGIIGFGCENPLILVKAINYIKKHKGKIFKIL